MFLSAVFSLISALPLIYFVRFLRIIRSTLIWSSVTGEFIILSGSLFEIPISDRSRENTADGHFGEMISHAIINSFM